MSSLDKFWTSPEAILDRAHLSRAIKGEGKGKNSKILILSSLREYVLEPSKVSNPLTSPTHPTSSHTICQNSNSQLPSQLIYPISIPTQTIQYKKRKQIQKP